MKVEVEIEEIDLQGDHGPVPSVQATCGRCGHTTDSFGQHDASRRRCLALLREECPRNENNFYEESV